jgi:hypothetical protein
MPEASGHTGLHSYASLMRIDMRMHLRMGCFQQFQVSNKKINEMP